MAINIDIHAKMRSTVNEVVPLILLSSVMLVFFDVDDWSFANVLKEMLRAIAISLGATTLALTCLWVGLKTAMAKQSILFGWATGAAVFLTAVLMSLAIFRNAGWAGS